jgi:hypothetical protein
MEKGWLDPHKTKALLDAASSMRFYKRETEEYKEAESTFVSIYEYYYSDNPTKFDWIIHQQLADAKIIIENLANNLESELRYRYNDDFSYQGESQDFDREMLLVNEARKFIGEIKCKNFNHVLLESET